MNKKIFRVKLKYFEHFLSSNLIIPCMGTEYGSFFFNWSLETAKQFIKHLMSMQPTKFYISSTSEIEAVTSKTEIFQKIMEGYSKIGNKKIDKFEFISIIPFLVESNCETALSTSMSYFCLENENMDIITKSEVGLFIDSFFRSVHNILLLDEKDELYQKTKDHILKISETDLDEFLNEIFKNDEEELPVSDVIRKIPNNLTNMIKVVNNGLYQSNLYYNKKIKEDNMLS